MNDSGKPCRIESQEFFKTFHGNIKNVSHRFQ